MYIYVYIHIYCIYVYIVVGGSIRNFQQLPFEAFHDRVLLDRCWPFLGVEESIVAAGAARRGESCWHHLKVTADSQKMDAWWKVCTKVWVPNCDHQVYHIF